MSFTPLQEKKIFGKKSCQEIFTYFSITKGRKQFPILFLKKLGNVRFRN
jgi:hypothetical protein